MRWLIATLVLVLVVFGAIPIGILTLGAVMIAPAVAEQRDKPRRSMTDHGSPLPRPLISRSLCAASLNAVSSWATDKRRKAGSISCWRAPHTRCSLSN